MYSIVLPSSVQSNTVNKQGPEYWKQTGEFERNTVEEAIHIPNKLSDTSEYQKYSVLKQHNHTQMSLASSSQRNYFCNSNSISCDSKKKRSRVIYCHVCCQYKPRSTRARFQVCQHIACYDCVRLALMVQQKCNLKAHCPFCLTELDWNKVKPFIVLFKASSDGDDKNLSSNNNSLENISLGAASNFQLFLDSSSDQTLSNSNTMRDKILNSFFSEYLKRAVCEQAYLKNQVGKIQNVQPKQFTRYLQYETSDLSKYSNQSIYPNYLNQKSNNSPRGTISNLNFNSSISSNFSTTSFNSTSSLLSYTYDENNRRGFACGLFNPSIPTDGINHNTTVLGTKKNLHRSDSNISSEFSLNGIPNSSLPFNSNQYWKVAPLCLDMKDILDEWRNSTFVQGHSDVIICSI
ncbi:uncharacterized protein CMU_035690 [Cryptosporidium muris RN66]|uniref:RING-type domain-containing protein n=1 Tax=Cryptosporidium muris (strain RN66) TaxID=441375 RepID=B6AGQ5_CRYMR|nr:uncharacterized protein CMU_035690 [Cryptosporidium muris RN66]EEA07396.1 hypothetical protein, conserved [Cryptosporidium muris RN66]|eukprot:XP_002141745.1 hypothetical protein [Cryptosporidium muris RN66]